MEVVIDWSSSCGYYSDTRKRMQQLVSEPSILGGERRLESLQSNAGIRENRRELELQPSDSRWKKESQQFEARREKWRLEFQQLLRNIISESGGEVAEGKELSCVQEEDQQVDNVEFQNSSDFDGREPSEVANDGVEHLISVRHEEIDMELEFGKFESCETTNKFMIMKESSGVTNYLKVENSVGVNETEVVEFEFPKRIDFLKSVRPRKNVVLPPARENASLEKLVVIFPSPVHCYFSLKWLSDWDHKPKVKMKLLAEHDDDKFFERNNACESYFPFSGFHAKPVDGSSLSLYHGSVHFLYEIGSDLEELKHFWPDFEMADESNMFGDFNLSRYFRKMYVRGEIEFPNGVQSCEAYASGEVLMSFEKYEAFDVSKKEFFRRGGFNIFGGKGFLRIQGKNGYAIVGMQHDQKKVCLIPLPSTYGFLAEAQGFILDIARDQHDCRILQKIFKEGNSEDVRIIFNEIIDPVVELMVNQYRNYLMQKLLEGCNEEQEKHLVLRVTEEYSMQTDVDGKAKGSAKREEAYGAIWGARWAEQILLNFAFSNNTYYSLTWLLVRFPKPMVKIKFIAQHDEELSAICLLDNILELIYLSANFMELKALVDSLQKLYYHEVGKLILQLLISKLCQIPEKVSRNKNMIRANIPNHNLVSGEICATKKDEVSSLIAGLRKVKIFTDCVTTHRAKKACREEGEYAYSFDSDSLDEYVAGESNKAKEDGIHEVISEELEVEASENVMENSHPLMFTQLIDTTWKARREEVVKKFEGLCMVIRNVLGNKVEKVSVFDCVVDFSCCSVTRKCGWTVKKIVEISFGNPIKEELRKRVDYMDKLRELGTNCRKFAGLMTEETEGSGEVSVRVINEHHGIDGKYIHGGETPATSLWTELVVGPLAGKMKVHKLSDIGSLMSIWFPKPKVKMKLGKIRHKKLGSMIPCGQGILRGRDCCNHNLRGMPRQLLRKTAGASHYLTTKREKEEREGTCKPDIKRAKGAARPPIHENSV